VNRSIQHEPVEIDGSSHSGSGTIVRLAVALSALGGAPVHVYNVRAARPRPGLARQHLEAVRALKELTAGEVSGAHLGSREFEFVPGALLPSGHHRFSIGSAGSATALALAVLPVLAFSPEAVEIEIEGGLFQDYAPSMFHLEHVIVPLLTRMDLEVEIAMLRPGYVPKGEGILRITLPGGTNGPLRPLELERAGPVERIWGISLSSHLAERRVSRRMSEAARAELVGAGYEAVIEEREEMSSVQAGAALALFADLKGGARLGADRAGLPRRSAESIGRHAARQLLAEIEAGACVDRFAGDQIVAFLALARGQSRLRIAQRTDHLMTALWLADRFLGARGWIEGSLLKVDGIGMPRPMAQATSGHP
jgi:RNA 3'-terminal phosphate cyclase (ATP)